MSPPLSDTTPEAEAVQIELLRQATVEQRLALVFSLTHTVICQSRRAMARANPDLDQRELDLLFVRLCYGTELADEVRRCLEARGR